jgi:hypothetical protein
LDIGREMMRENCIASNHASGVVAMPCGMNDICDGWNSIPLTRRVGFRNDYGFRLDFQ